MKEKFLKKTNIFIIISVLVLFALLMGMKPAFADGLVPCGSSTNTDACTLCHLIVGFQNIFNFLKNLLLTATTMFIVVAGVLYMISTGNKNLMDWAKKAITYSLTGFILFLCSWLIVTVVLTALGYKKVGSWSTFTCETTTN